ncbi:MAG: hypothetical protein LBF88_05150 [Planctomycetaceae bacterium]|jgi:hypothetical protein|nr:hypothetical protein [Planctomycetaceae bacterium]
MKIKNFYSFILFVIGLLLGYAIYYFTTDDIKIVYSSSVPKSSIQIEFEKDTNNELSSFVKQLSEPSRFYKLPLLTTQVYDDNKRFSIHTEKYAYNIATELYGFLPENKKVIMRTYNFRENDIDIRITITREFNTNKPIEIMYSFGNNIIYLDENCDGTWDTIKGTTLQPNKK